MDFCATHNVASDVEVLPIQNTNEAYERIVKSDVRYRFVIDMATLRLKDRSAALRATEGGRPHLGRVWGRQASCHPAAVD
jgi:hypothetical protein